MRSENAISRGFILPDGTVAKNGTQHDDIAMDYICSMKMLKRYDKSMYRDLCDFMVFELGAIKVGCNISRNPKVITFIESNINEEQWTYIEYYMKQGYILDRL